MRTNILTFPRWEKTSTGVGELWTGHKQVGIEDGEEGTWIIEFRVWTETESDGERVVKWRVISSNYLIFV
jgi:hypothetical protein